MATSKELTEDLIKELNGCGRYQILSTIIVMLAEASAVWSMMAMVFNGKEIGYRCDDGVVGVNASGQFLIGSINNSMTYDPVKSCRTMNDTECDAFRYDADINIVVNEWDLICDLKWTVAMITTIQMAGVLVGCFVIGQLGDLVGRKPMFYLSNIILVVFNVVAYFSVNWEMYAAVRFFLGIGVGGFLVTRYVLLTEFMSSSWRPRIMAIPGWSANSALYALFVWLLKDWQHLHLATAAAGFPFLFTYWYIDTMSLYSRHFMQESSRWQMTKQRYKSAEQTINNIARINGKPSQDITKLVNRFKQERDVEDQDKTHTVLDLFKTASNIRTTLGLLFIWFSISYVYYGLTFGVSSLAGDFYLNLFLNNIIETPTSIIVVITLSRLGRKYSCVLFFILTGLCGLVSGTFQYIDTPSRGTVVTVFALITKMTLSITWGCLAVYTTELYPTVVRTIGYGICNTAARVGGMVAPQTVFLGDTIPGLLYFPNAVLSIISGLLCLLFTETRDAGLEDTLKVTVIKPATKHGEDGHDTQAVYTVEKI